MRKERILAVIMSVLLTLSMLPMTVFAAETTTLNGKLNIQGIAAEGKTLSADFKNVDTEGLTEDDVTYLWSRKTFDDEAAENAGEIPELKELGKEKTYTVTKEDIGVKWDGYILNKYPIETETAFQGTDYPLARWADVLLMYAEADVRLNKTVSTSAIDCVNQVRHRAGLADLPAEKTASVNDFLDALLEERGHEFYYEGHRRIDLIRFNKYYTIMDAIGCTPTSQYFPIPNYAVDQATDMGYTLTQYFTRPDYDGPQR